MSVQEMLARFRQHSQRLTELVWEPLREQQYYEVEPDFMSHISSFCCCCYRGIWRMVGFVTYVPYILLFEIRKPFNIMSHV